MPRRRRGGEAGLADDVHCESLYAPIRETQGGGTKINFGCLTHRRKGVRRRWNERQVQASAAQTCVCGAPASSDVGGDQSGGAGPGVSDSIGVDQGDDALTGGTPTTGKIHEKGDSMKTKAPKRVVITIEAETGQSVATIRKLYGKGVILDGVGIIRQSQVNVIQPEE